MDLLNWNQGQKPTNPWNLCPSSQRELKIDMTHELKKIIKAYKAAQEEGKTAVLATVVDLEGSSYRRPGVRMLLISDGRFIGAVSGGCVEKEIWRQAQEVFNNGVPKVMTYDGRYRLGCEGILYILIEPFNPDNSFNDKFWKVISNRDTILCRSYFSESKDEFPFMGSVINVNAEDLKMRPEFKPKEGLKIHEQTLEPCLRLLIIGAEHDAVQLCSYAAMTGWEVTILASPSEEKGISDFPGASELIAINAEELDMTIIDKQTAVVLMTHSYVKDLAYLISLRSSQPMYLGLLGPSARREKLLDEFLERYPDTHLAFIENIHGPAGLNIGAETPQEIAISIISEILSFQRQTHPLPLKDKSGAIHQ